MSTTEVGTGVPSPFPTPLQTATAAQNTNLQNTTPQTGMAAKTIQPLQAAAPVQNAQPVNPPAQPNNTPARPFVNASTYNYLT